MKIKIDNLNINYEVHGEGQDVFLIHGWGCNLNTVKFISNILERKYRVFSIDLPGFGESDTQEKPWGVKEYGEVVKKFIRKVGKGNPIVIGHSVGGRVGIWLAANMEMEKLVLVDSAGIKKELSAKSKIKIKINKILKKIIKAIPFINKFSDRILDFAKSLIGSTDYKNAKPVLRESLVRIVNEDLRYLMKEIKTDTLLIWGENDTDTPVTDGKKMEESIKNAGLAVIKNAGHYSFLDQPMHFRSILESFL